MKKIAFATSGKIPKLTDDDRSMAGPLRRRGIELRAAVWDDAAQDWGEFDAVVIRSCWDYHLRPEEFARWVSRLDDEGVRLWNPPRVVKWNMEKFYLRELQEKGHRVVPTVWLEKGPVGSLLGVLEDRGWDRAVVKPTISATAFQTWTTSRARAVEDQPRFEEMSQRGGLMVQGFVDEVLTRGELSFMFFDKKHSHTIRKRPRPGEFRVQEEYGGLMDAYSPPEPLLEQATRLVESFAEPLLFARVDGVEVGGELLLMELELIEPSLYLDFDPAGTERFADAIARAHAGR